jgi:subtilase family serine protease
MNVAVRIPLRADPEMGAGHARPVRLLICLLALLLAPVWPARAVVLRTLPMATPEAAVRLRALGRLPAEKSLRLAIGLPLRQREALTNLLQRLYDPASPDYHHYLTPEQFTEQFGPAQADYQAVIDFARNNGLAVAATHDSRLLLDVQGKVSDVERAFHVALHSYQHPAEARQFYAPDVASSG